MSARRAPCGTCAATRSRRLDNVCSFNVNPCFAIGRDSDGERRAFQTPPPRASHPRPGRPARVGLPLSFRSKAKLTMAQADIIYTPDPDAESISSDVAEFNGVLVTTQIPTHADGSLELGGIV